MPPDPTAEAERPAMASISGVTAVTRAMKRASGLRFGSAVNRPSTSESSTRQSARGHLRHAGAQAIIVAVADLGRGHRVVLVDDRQCPQGQQRFQRGPRIQIALPLLAVLQRQQHLRHGDTMLAQQLLVGMGQADLPDGRRGLALIQPQRPRGKPQLASAQRNGAGGHQDDLLSALRADACRSSTRPVSHPRRRWPVSGSTSRAEPTLTTMRRAASSGDTTFSPVALMAKTIRDRRRAGESDARRRCHLQQSPLKLAPAFNS